MKKEGRHARFVSKTPSPKSGLLNVEIVIEAQLHL